jgi:hypothetical protein
MTMTKHETEIMANENFETRNGMLSSGIDVGVNEGFDKLDELLAKGLR